MAKSAKTPTGGEHVMTGYSKEPETPSNAAEEHAKSQQGHGVRKRKKKKRHCCLICQHNKKIDELVSSLETRSSSIWFTLKWGSYFFMWIALLALFLTLYRRHEMCNVLSNLEKHSIVET